MRMLIFLIATLGFVGICSNAQSLPEKAEASAKTVKRSLKKGVHRTEEALCGKLNGDNKAQCLAKEAKNRIEEGKDAVVDKAVEVKNAVDTDNK